MAEPLVGTEAAAALREGLAAADNPLRFVEQFQRENSLPPEFAEECAPVLQLLDVLGVTRHQFHTLLIARLRDELIRAASADAAAASRLAFAAFPHVRVPELRPAALAALGAMRPGVPDALLRALAAQSDVYSACPPHVRRQVWRAEPATLAREVAPALAEYAAAARSRRSPLLWWSQQQHQQEKRPAAAIRLAALARDACGLVAEHLHRVHAATGDATAAALRCDVLMALHDTGECADVCARDPAHALIWALDACCRDGALDAARVREIRAAEARAPRAAAAFAAANPRTVAVALQNAFAAASALSAAQQRGAAGAADAEDVLATACHIVCLADQARELAANPDLEPRPETEAALASFVRCIVAGAPLESISTAVHCSRVCRRALLFRAASLAAASPAQPGTAKLLDFVAGLDSTELADEPTFARSVVAAAVEQGKPPLPQLVLDSLMPHCSVPAIRESLVGLICATHALLARADLPKAAELIAVEANPDELQGVSEMVQLIRPSLSQEDDTRIQALIAQLRAQKIAPQQSFEDLADAAVAAAEAQQQQQQQQQQLRKSPSPPPPEMIDDDDDM